jgi:hypothetical protein
MSSHGRQATRPSWLRPGAENEHLLAPVRRPSGKRFGSKRASARRLGEVSLPCVRDALRTSLSVCELAIYRADNDLVRAVFELPPLRRIYWATVCRE